jgi:cell shape-determining protein MreC
MDGIFPYGIKVGKVIKLYKNDITQKVYIKPYAKIIGQRYFLLYKD